MECQQSSIQWMEFEATFDRLYQTLNQSEASEMLKCRQQMIDIYLLPLDAADATAQGGGRLHPQMAIAIHLHVFAMVAVLGLAARYHRAVLQF